MSKLREVVKLTNEQMDVLCADGYIEINGITYYLNDNSIYLTPHLEATSDKPGSIRIASDEEFAQGTSTSTAITPAQLQATVNGIVSGALGIGEASTEVSGTIKLASDEDIELGTNTTKAVTPAQLKAVLSTTDLEGNVINPDDVLLKTNVKKLEFEIPSPVAFAKNEDGTLSNVVATSSISYDSINGTDYSDYSAFMTTSVFSDNIVPAFNDLVSRVASLETEFIEANAELDEILGGIVNGNI